MNKEKSYLAAVMFTDIVGYSALSHTNEALAMELLAEHRKLIRGILLQHSGIEIKTIGDAFLIKFNSVLDATNCAIAIQKAERDHIQRLPQNKIFKVRIGIHLGDIVDTENDIFGDAVNIASRLQSLAPTGGIYVSGSVYYQVYKKVPNRFIQLKMHHLKNIKMPIRIYDLRVDELAQDPMPIRMRNFFKATKKIWVHVGFASALTSGFLLALLWNHNYKSTNTSLEKNRIAVLPFANISKNESDQYLSDGLTDELISTLSRVKELRVLSKSSLSKYAVSEKKPKIIGAELGVGTIIEGSVLKIENRLRVNVKVIDATTEENIWSERFDAQVKDTLEIEQKIAAAVRKHFYKGRPTTSIDQNSLKTAENKEAYLKYLKGRYFIARRSLEGLKKAVDELQDAVKLNPKLADAYGALASAADLLGYYGHLSPAKAAADVKLYSNIALSIDAQNTEALISLAEIQAYYDLEPKKAEQTFRRAIETNPNHATAHQWYAEFLTLQQKFPAAIIEATQAINLDPLSLTTNTAIGMNYYYSRNYSIAEQKLEAVIKLDPSFELPYYWIGLSLVQHGEFKQAILMLEKAVKTSNNSPMMMAGLAYAQARSGNKNVAEKILEQMNSLAEKKYVSPYDLATVYAGLGNEDLLIKSLRNAFRERVSRLSALKVDPVFDPYRNKEKFSNLLDRIFSNK